MAGELKYKELGRAPVRASVPKERGIRQFDDKAAEKLEKPGEKDERIWVDGIEIRVLGTLDVERSQEIYVNRDLECLLGAISNDTARCGAKQPKEAEGEGR